MHVYFINCFNAKLYRETLPVAPTVRFTLLVAKYFIYKCFLNENSLDFEFYKIQLHEKALTEQFIATKNNTITAFNNKWQPLISKKFISGTV